MSILEKIRTKSGLLVGIIAVALVVFVLESALDSGNQFFSSKRTVVGEILGKEISIQEFESKIQKAEDNEKARSGKTSIDEYTQENLRNQVWNEIVMERLMKIQYADLGISVTKEELLDMVQGKNPHPSVVQAFTNPQTGVFDPNQVAQFIKNLDKDETGDTKQRWLNFEQAIKQERLTNKFYNMIKKGIYVTKAEAKRAYINQNQTFQFNTVVKKYYTVADSTIKVSDEELKKYYNENKYKYKQDFNSRSIEYVSFDVNPSEEDKQTTINELLKLGNEFASAANDSEFVNMNADSKFSAQYVSKQQLPFGLDTLFDAQIGKMVGPVFDGKFYKLAKLTAIKFMPDSVKARHILIKPINGDIAKAKSKADSLKSLIQKGAKFDVLAKTNSEDPGSGEKGGDLGFFKEGMMVKPFNDACFNGKVGELQVVESQFGVHLIEVTARGKEAKKVLISYVDRAVEPSSKTFQVMYQKASEFAGKNNSKELFEKAVTEQKLTKIPAMNFKDIDRNVSGLQNSRQIVRWAFEANKGDVSQVFELDNKYVVALLTEVKEKGILAFDDVKKQVEFEVIKDKKAEQFINEFNAKLQSAQSLVSFSSSVNIPVDSVKSASFVSPFLPSGRENLLIGHVVASKPGFIKKAIKGDNGVYVIDLIKINEPAPTQDYKAVIDQVGNQVRSRVDYEVFEAMKTKANIEDYRAKFY